MKKLAAWVIGALLLVMELNTCQRIVECRDNGGHPTKTGQCLP